MKIKNIYLTQLYLIIALTCTFCKNKSADLQVNKNQSVNLVSNDSFDYLPLSTYNQVITHSFYTLSYAEQYEQAEWVAYELKPTAGNNKHYKRPFFIQDALVKTESADWRNYKKSGYDKGHLCPAADMAFSVKAYNDTFYTSNISPQTHAFNSGVWNTLEQKVRYWAQKYNGIYVITGPVLRGTLKKIGKEHVAVPEYFYKIVFKKSETETKMIAFLVPSAGNEKPLYDYALSVDELEKRTGINFFPALPDPLENELEANNSYKMWSF